MAKKKKVEIANLKAKILKFYKSYQRRFNLAVLLVLFVILIPFFYRFWELNQVVKALDSTDKALIDEIGNRLESSAGAYTNSQSLGLAVAQDLNELRSALLLPPKDYSKFVAGEQVSSDEEFDLKSAIYSELSNELAQSELAAKRSANEELFRKLAQDFASVFKNPDLSLGTLQSSEQRLSYKLNFKGAALATLMFNLEDAQFSLEIRYLQYLATDNGDEWQAALQDLGQEDFTTLSTNLAVYSQSLSDLDAYLNSQELAKILAERHITFEKQDPWPEKTPLYLFRNSAAEEIGRLETSAHPLTFTLSNDKKLTDLESLKLELSSFLQNIETASESEKQAHDQLVKMEETFQEGAFQEYLADNHLKLAPKRDNPDRVTYDVVKEDGSIFYSFALDKATLELLVLDSKGQELKRLGSKKN